MGAVLKKAITEPIKGITGTLKGIQSGDWKKALEAAPGASAKTWVAHSKDYGIGQEPLKPIEAPPPSILAEDPNRSKQKSIYTY